MSKKKTKFNNKLKGSQWFFAGGIGDGKKVSCGKCHNQIVKGTFINGEWLCQTCLDLQSS